MKMMMSHDQNDTIATALNKEDSKKPPSLLHLSVANDFIECAEWYNKYYECIMILYAPCSVRLSCEKKHLGL